MGRGDGRGTPQGRGREGRANMTDVPVQQEQEETILGAPVALGPLQDGRGPSWLRSHRKPALRYFNTLSLLSSLKLPFRYLGIDMKPGAGECLARMWWPTAG